MDKQQIYEWNLEALPQGSITGLLSEWNKGDEDASRQLFDHVYDALCERAAYYLRRESAGQTLNTCDLVNEVYLRLSGQNQLSFSCRGEFFAFSARLMRFVLVERARARLSHKRGGGVRAQTIDGLELGNIDMGLDAETLLALNDSLESLSQQDPRLGSIVEMRYFAGMTNREIGDILSVSERTVQREWQMARRWLTRHLKLAENENDESSTAD